MGPLPWAWAWTILVWHTVILNTLIYFSPSFNFRAKYGIWLCSVDNIFGGNRFCVLSKRSKSTEKAKRKGLSSSSNSKSKLTISIPLSCSVWDSADDILSKKAPLALSENTKIPRPGLRVVFVKEPTSRLARVVACPRILPRDEWILENLIELAAAKLVIFEIMEVLVSGCVWQQPFMRYVLPPSQILTGQIRVSHSFLNLETFMFFLLFFPTRKTFFFI